jgi:prolyl-tRNA synthetase
VAIELSGIQQGLFNAALALQRAKTVTNLKNLAEFKAYFGQDTENSFMSGQGFVRAKWSGDMASLKMLDELGVTIRCIPFDQDGKSGSCILTGSPSTQDVIFARAY